MCWALCQAMDLLLLVSANNLFHRKIMLRYSAILFSCFSRLQSDINSTLLLLSLLLHCKSRIINQKETFSHVNRDFFFSVNVILIVML